MLQKGFRNVFCWRLVGFKTASLATSSEPVSLATQRFQRLFQHESTVPRTVSLAIELPHNGFTESLAIRRLKNGQRQPLQNQFNPRPVSERFQRRFPLTKIFETISSATYCLKNCFTNAFADTRSFRRKFSLATGFTGNRSVSKSFFWQPNGFRHGFNRNGTFPKMINWGQKCSRIVSIFFYWQIASASGFTGTGNRMLSETI